MRSQEFVIWLRGILDVTDGDMGEKTTKIVKHKLNGLFEHEHKKPNKNTTDGSIYGDNPLNGGTPLVRC